MKNKKYWEFKGKSGTNEADLYLYLEIASWGGGFYAQSAKSFKDELDALGDIKTLNIYINSPGGDVFEGDAIYNMLKRKSKKCKVNVFIDGMAASIASVIAMAGDCISMPKNTMLMIHAASTRVYGQSEDLEKGAVLLKKINESIKQTYLDRSKGKLDKDTLDEMFTDGDNWLSAQECLDYGLCDEITEEVQFVAKYDKEVLASYKNVPKAFCDGKNDEEGEENSKVNDEIGLIIARIKSKSEKWNLI